MRLPTPVHHIHVVRRGVVGDRIRVDRHLNLGPHLVAVRVIDLYCGSVACDDEHLLKIFAVKDRMRRFHVLDCMNQLVGFGIEN